MSREPGEYVRVYLSIREDPRFAEVYGDNDRLATWLRLLMEADAVWPAAAPVPRAVHEPSLAALVEAGIIELRPLDHYRVHGLDAERERRSELGRIGGLASGVARARTAVERPLNGRRTETNTQRRAAPSNATPRNARENGGSNEPPTTTTKNGAAAPPPLPGELPSEYAARMAREANP